MERLHISFFGPRNAGKSSLINALVGQEVSIVSDVPGTTTDPVAKPMELHPLGAVMITDTAGYDDEGALGKMRVTRTKQVLHKTDVAVFVVPSNITDNALIEAKEWWQMISTLAKKSLLVVNKMSDDTADNEIILARVTKALNAPKAEIVNAKTALGVKDFIATIGRTASDGVNALSVLGHLVKPHDVVMLVMPQDLQAPKGRLILPQVQTIRDLLDNKCIVVSCTAENFEVSLAALAKDPDLIVTDSQVFSDVYAQKPKSSMLTSFSVLMARMKGDIHEFVAAAKTLASLNADSKVLIAEACTHAPLAEDIGREKIPAMLRKRFGQNISIDMVAGNDWPNDIEKYDLIIHCGACMFNSAHVKTRQRLAKKHQVPMTNYGVFIAEFNNIIDKIVY